MMNDTKGFPLQEFYSRIYKKYDLINRIFTFNLDEKWRKKTSRECLKGAPNAVLDLCCGTGDLTVRLAKESHHKTKIVGYDFSHEMLVLAKRKAASKNMEEIDFIEGDAANMPFENNSFDAIGITFGFRNLTYENPNEKRHLEEIKRILKKGGKLVILESGYPENAFIRFFYRLYLNLFLIPLGGILSGDLAAYRYLAKSSERFYTSSELCKKFVELGFSRFEHRALLFGASNIFVVVK